MKPTIICLTPVRNEAWILDKFLQAASIWADYIIISDQMSTDGSRDIAVKYSKVILIDNEVQKDFSEYGLRKPLIDEARKIKGLKLLIALDADEVFTPNFESEEWEKIINLPEGSIIKFPWLNIWPKFEYYWSIGSNIPVGYIDDGAEFESGLLHACRLFDPNVNSKTIFITEEIKILHLQYTDWNRMETKHRWYQCFEKINYPKKSALEIYRQYHHMYAVTKDKFELIPANWILGYKNFNICIQEVIFEDKLCWDEKVLVYFQEYGTTYFKKLAIWDVDWSKKAQVFGKQIPFSLKDPRSNIDKLIHKWFKFSQNKLDKRMFRRIDRLIKVLLKY